MQDPPIPPANERGLNASEKIRAKTCGSDVIFSTITITATAIYMTPINGTITSVICTIRLPPPMMQNATRTASTAPMITGVLFGS